MANMRLPNASRSAMITALAALADGGSIEIRSGTQPASANDSATGTLLATLTLSNPAADDVTDGVATLDTITEDSAADATGTASWARVKASGGATVLDCDVGTSGATININTVNIVTGGPVRMTGFTLTQASGE